MTIYTIEPRDTLVLRDGRPFVTGAISGKTLAFPWPSSVAGLARTLIGSDAEGRFVERDVTALANVPIRGPWLARGDAADEFLYPAPRDCVWFKAEGVTRYRLVPKQMPAGAESDLRDHALVGFAAEPPQGKPDHGPAFWTWPELRRWLLAPEDRVRVDGAFGMPELARERRVHVAISSETQTAEQGMLFSTDGLRFSHGGQRLAVAFACDDPRLETRCGLASFGGERRVSFVRRSSQAVVGVPDEIMAEGGRRLRVILLTPAVFRTGSVPKEILGARTVAAVVGRPEVSSGWDYNLGRPKPSRRMAPAGSVYWVDLGDMPVGDWIERVWMRNISDDQRDCRDGFGLAVVGVA